jgi:hypothetical protein
LLAPGLSPADEPFLESCLKDRSKTVREAAAGLLARLPGSAYVARMTARADAMISLEEVKKGLLKKKTASLVVEPPQVWDASLAAEGLDEKPPGGMGKRAWWLRQILTVVPPAHWSARFKLPADDLLRALDENDYEKDVLAAWIAAASNAADADWCLALARHGVTRKKGHAVELRPLWAGLAPEAREAVIRRVIGHAKTTWQEQLEVLGTADHAWSADFSREMIGILAASVPGKQADWWAVGPGLDHLSYGVHADAGAVLESLIQRLFKDDPPPSITKALDRLRLRGEMHKEFQT